MKKRLIVGLTIVCFAFLLPTVVSAQKMPSLPDGARLITPDSMQKIGERGEVLETLSPRPQGSSVGNGVISEPNMYVYTVPGQKGARLGVGTSAEFPITRMAMWLDRALVGGVTSTFLPGVVRSLVPGENPFQQDLGFLTPEILRVGVHSVKVRVYPDYPRSRVHFLGMFTVEVKSFEFWVSGCVEGDIVHLSFYISPIGEMPEWVTITTSAFVGSAQVVDDVATLPFHTTTYEKVISGQELDTTITEVGGANRSATQLLWYPPLAELGTCYVPCDDCKG